MQIASKIDHTLLKPSCQEMEIIRICEEAIENNFYAVCVPPYHLKTAAKVLSSKAPRLCTVIGFPLGYDTFTTKVSACKEALSEGAQEIDMVINFSAFKSGHIHSVYQEVEKLSELCHKNIVPLKTIIETAFLNKDEIRMICGICVEAGADFIKTSTGFADKGATIEDVEFLRQILPARIKIKASGGVRSYEEAIQLIDAGADRIGTSNGINIVKKATELLNQANSNQVY